MYRDEEGKLNGVFAERAISLLQSLGLNDKLRPASAQVSEAVENMQQYLLSASPISSPTSSCSSTRAVSPMIS